MLLFYFSICKIINNIFISKTLKMIRLLLNNLDYRDAILKKIYIFSGSTNEGSRGQIRTG